MKSFRALPVLHLSAVTAFTATTKPPAAAFRPGHVIGEPDLSSAPSSPSHIPRRSTNVAGVSSPLGLFNLFGGDDNETKGDGDELAVFSSLASTDQKFESLAEYIKEWGALFEGDDSSISLTTPVTVFPSTGDGLSSLEVEGGVDVEKALGVRIVFQPTKTRDAYKNKDEERDTDGSGQPLSKEEEEPKKEGGVEVLAEKMSDGTVRVRASRCDVDEGTMIKEMSEETILKELKQAIDVWKKEQG